MSKELKFIKSFSNLSITTICKEKNINRSNLLNGKTTKEKEKIIMDYILEKIILILAEYYE